MSFGVLLGFLALALVLLVVFVWTSYTEWRDEQRDQARAALTPRDFADQWLAHRKRKRR